MHLKDKIKHLEELKHLDYSKVNYDALYKDMKIILGGLSFNYQVIKKEVLVYRGVTRREKPKCTKDISYPPQRCVSEYGRCNKPHNPVFYGTFNYNAIFHEINPQVNDKVYVSAWEVKSEFKCASIIGSSELIKQCSELEYIFRYVDDIMRKNVKKNNEYKVSAAIFQCLCDQGDYHDIENNVGGLVYPSVAHVYNVENLAIKKHFVDSNLALKWVEEFTINTVESNRIGYTVTDFATDLESGQIRWNGNSDWSISVPVGKTIYVEAIDNEYIIRDEMNNKLKWNKPRILSDS